MAVAEKVKSIIVEQLGVDEEEVTPDASFVDDLGADSLDTVELVMAFEEEFDIEIPDDAAEHIQTVGDAVKFIEERTNGLEVVSPTAPLGAALLGHRAGDTVAYETPTGAELTVRVVEVTAA